MSNPEPSAEAWADVRSQFIKANKLENDHPIPLVQYSLHSMPRGRWLRSPTIRTLSTPTRRDDSCDRSRPGWQQRKSRRRTRR